MAKNGQKIAFGNSESLNKFNVLKWNKILSEWKEARARNVV